MLASLIQGKADMAAARPPAGPRAGQAFTPHSAMVVFHIANKATRTVDDQARRENDDNSVMYMDDALHRLPSEGGGLPCPWSVIQGVKGQRARLRYQVLPAWAKAAWP